MKNPNTLQIKEAWILFFILGVVMLNYPFIQIFNKTTTIFGIPTLILYFMLGWPGSILVIYLFSKRLGKDSDNDYSGREKGKEQE